MAILNDGVVVAAAIEREITSDPQRIGLTWDRQDFELLDIFNVPRIEAGWSRAGGWTNVDAFVPLPSLALFRWSADAGRAARINAARTNAVLPEQIRAIAIVADRILDRPDTILDLRLPDNQRMVDALRMAGVLTEADQTALVSLAVARQGLAYMLIGRNATLRDVSSARRIKEARDARTP